MSDTYAGKTKEPSDGSSNWVEYRRMILSTLEDMKIAQERIETKVNGIQIDIAKQKGATAAVSAVLSLVFGGLGAAIVAYIKKGNTP